MQRDFKTSKLNDELDSTHAIRIGDRVWWVGHYLPGDQFQCHVYLIENGDQSVLIDPGSYLTFKYTLTKIEEIMPFSNIRYFIFHHQDPDITSAFKIAEPLISRKDAMIISHWRAETLLKHYDFKTPFWRIEDHQWFLDIGGRILKFIFTPYLHFPGAFCTFDENTGILFSSDLFGGFTDGFRLYAENESYFDSIQPFHEHYMPSREILQYGLSQIQEYPVKLIAPQHGSIIPEPLIGYIIEKLKNIDCGLFAVAKKNIDIQRLSRLNKALKEITQTLVVYRDFREVGNALLGIFRSYIPSSRILEFYTQIDKQHVYYFSPATRYRGKQLEVLDKNIDALLFMDRATWEKNRKEPYALEKTDYGYELIIPLFAIDNNTVNSIARLKFSGEIESDYELREVVAQMSMPLEIALEREVIFHVLENDRQKYYHQSIHDSLTGLFTRVYMYDTLERMCNLHDREKTSSIGIILIDVDHFKLVNDNFGHITGDSVLQNIAGIIKKSTRVSDIPVRLGGEEFAVFCFDEEDKSLKQVSEKIRKRIETAMLIKNKPDYRVTVSIGITQRQRKESMSDFIHRADSALYEAKNTGRNKICFSNIEQAE